MRLLFSPNPNQVGTLQPGSINHFESGFLNGLKSVGCEVFIWDGVDALRLEEALGQFKPELFVGYLRGASAANCECSYWTKSPLVEALIRYRKLHGLWVALFAHPESAAFLSEYDVEVDGEAYHCCRGAPSPTSEDVRLAEESFVDVLMHPFSKRISKTCFDYWHGRGVPVIEMPFAADTTVHYPAKRPIELTSTISYIGNWRASKGLQMDKYLSSGTVRYGEDMKIFGSGFPYPNRGLLADEQFNPIVWSSAISLAFHEPSQVKKTPLLVSGSVFKVLACQGFLLCDRNPGLEEYFDENEIETFSTLEEFFNKIDFYRKYPEARLPYVKAGYRSIIRKNSYRHRAAKLLNFINQQKPIGKSLSIQKAEALRKGATRGGGKSDEVLRHVPVKAGMKILDVGLGTGEATQYFLEKGLEVSATGLDIGTYGLDAAWFRENNVQLVQAMVEELDLHFEPETFDSVWIAHVIEHTMNPGVALRQVWKILKDDGWLFIAVPPYKSKIVGGHVNTGWNVGQLVYFLLLSGFDVKNGHFATIGYNVVGFCRKSHQQLPSLYYDIGDIERLGDYWPCELTQGTDGNIEAINWPPPNYEQS